MTDNEISDLIINNMELFKTYLLGLLNSAINKLKKNSYLIAHWIKQWINYLSYEEEFRNKTHHKYERGSVLNINFGFNIGSELGGIHYAIVIDKKDSAKKSMLAVIPLTSMKDYIDLSKLSKDKIFLGSFLTDTILNKVQNEVKSNVDLSKDFDNTKDDIKKTLRLLNNIKKADKHIDELSKMKFGSIAHIGQIKTISKMRIVSPTTKDDLLDNIKVPPNLLDIINDKIKELYIK